MKATDYSKTLKKEDKKYNRAKLKTFLQMKVAISEKKRHQMENLYSMFEHDMNFCRRDNSLPNGKYFKPTDIVLYAIIQKQDLGRVQKGITDLIKENLSHKFIGMSHDIDRTREIIADLDSIINGAKTWHNLSCLFDFDKDAELKKYIHHFKLRFRNFCASYIVLEIVIALEEEFQEELSNFARGNYVSDSKHIIKMWISNKGKSGAKIGYAIGGSVDAPIKSRLLYEQLQNVKTLFYKRIMRYFPMLKYGSHSGLYGINVFETNVLREDGLDFIAEDGLGIDNFDGFNLSDAVRLFVSTKTLDREDQYASDMMLVYNPAKIEHYEGYITPHSYVIAHLMDEYMDNMYTMIVYKNLGLYYLEKSHIYRNLVNRIATTKNAYRKLLKLKYDLEKEFYMYTKIDAELPIEKEALRVENGLKENDWAERSVCHSYHTVSQYTDRPVYIWKLIAENYRLLNADLNNKIQISASLNDYLGVKRTTRIAYSQLFLATMTFFFLVFPDKATELAGILTFAIECVKSFFANLR